MTHEQFRDALISKLKCSADEVDLAIETMVHVLMHQPEPHAIPERDRALERTRELMTNWINVAARHSPLPFDLRLFAEFVIEHEPTMVWCVLLAQASGYPTITEDTNGN